MANHAAASSLTLTRDQNVGKGTFILSKDHVEVVRVALDDLFHFLADFSSERYDEIAMHPDTCISHISALIYTARRLEQNMIGDRSDL
jgi:hypothetical protein